MKYESPLLIDAGHASSVVQGIAAMGVDPDGSDFPIHFEFEDDGEREVY